MNKKNIIILTVILLTITIVLTSVFINKKNSPNINIDDLVLTIEDVKLYDYNKDALNGEEKTDEYGVSNLTDLKEYVGGYQIYLDEMKPLEEYLGIEFTYFIVSYSTVSNESYLSIGLKETNNNLTNKKINKLIEWIENNEEKYFGQNDLVYTKASIDVYNKFDKKINIQDYSDKISNDVNYLTNKNITKLIVTSKKDKKIKQTNIIRLSKEEIDSIKKDTTYKNLTYKLKSSVINDSKSDLSATILVDKNDFNKLSKEEIIKFIYNEFDLYKSINEELNNMSLVIEDKKTNDILFKTENSIDFFEINSSFDKNTKNKQKK